MIVELHGHSKFSFALQNWIDAESTQHFVFVAKSSILENYYLRLAWPTFVHLGQISSVYFTIEQRRNESVCVIFDSAQTPSVLLYTLPNYYLFFCSYLVPESYVNYLFFALVCFFWKQVWSQTVSVKIDVLVYLTLWQEF